MRVVRPPVDEDPMRRLCHALLLPLLVGAVLLLPAQAASAASTSAAADVVQLAAEGEGGEVEGLEPGGANDSENANRPEEYEPNFLWGAAVGLAVLTVGGLGILALLYRLMVGRREASTS
jgi:hypothetical protein